MSSIAEVNNLSTADLRARLLTCCADPGWADRVVAMRPYTDVDALVQAGDVAFGNMDAAAVRRAVEAHPAIGARPTAADSEARWSRQEQQAVSAATTATQDELAEVNLAYRQRFGHVFLINATGRSAAEILSEARRRLANDPSTEAGQVARELRGIVRLRLRKLVIS